MNYSYGEIEKWGMSLILVIIVADICYIRWKCFVWIICCHTFAAFQMLRCCDRHAIIKEDVHNDSKSWRECCHHKGFMPGYLLKNDHLRHQRFSERLKRSFITNVVQIWKLNSKLKNFVKHFSQSKTKILSFNVHCTI